jgi:xanthine dehydrogenase accessory factor
VEINYYQRLLELRETNDPLWQATIIHTTGSSPAKPGMKMLVTPDSIHGNLGGGEMERSIIAYIRSAQPAKALQINFDLGSGEANESVPTDMICRGSATVFIESLFIPYRLFIIGAGHCGKALGHLAKLAGFWVKLIDDREDVLQACPKECRHVSQLNDYVSIAEAVEFGPNALIVIMTHGHSHDTDVLRQCLGHEYRYLGMIGSKSKVMQCFDSLLKQGYTQEDLTHIHAPIGLSIGSQNPYEIAVSITAELIRELRLGT